MYYMSTKLKSQLEKSYLISFEQWTSLTHSHMLQFEVRQPFWVPQP